MSDLPQTKSNSAKTKRTGRKRNGRFAKGNPGGPGRPPGPIRAGALALDLIGVDAAQDLMRVVIEQARAGNLKAAEIVLARVWPMRRGRPLDIDAPEIRGSSDLLPAQAAVTAAVLRGGITPQEGASVAFMLEAQQRLIEGIDYEPRLVALEKLQAARQAAERKR